MKIWDWKLKRDLDDHSIGHPIGVGIVAGRHLRPPWEEQRAWPVAGERRQGQVED